MTRKSATERQIRNVVFLTFCQKKQTLTTTTPTKIRAKLSFMAALPMITLTTSRKKNKKSNLQVRPHYNLSWESVIANNQLFFTQILSKVQPDKTTTKPKMIRTFNPSLILGKKNIFQQIFRWKTVEKKSFARWNFSIQRKTLDSQFFLHHGSATLFLVRWFRCNWRHQRKKWFWKKWCACELKKRVFVRVCVRVGMCERKRERAQDLPQALLQKTLYVLFLSLPLYLHTHTHKHSHSLSLSSAYGLSTLTESLKIKWFFSSIF